MRQRVVLALALAAEPELVIADEPTTALDVSVQAQIIALLKRLCRERGTAVMLITHDMGVIAETADRVAVMYAGRIVEIGPVRDVVKHAAASLHQRPDGLDPARSAADARAAGADPGRRCRGLTAIPTGCAFHPRCPHAFAPCRDAAARTASHAERSQVACWLHGVRTRRRRRREHDRPRRWCEVDRTSTPRIRRVEAVAQAHDRGSAAPAAGGSGRRLVLHQPARDLWRWSANPAPASRPSPRMVVGLLRPTAGNVIIDGIDHDATARRAGAPDAAPAHPDDLPGPLRQPQSALARRSTSSPSRSAPSAWRRTRRDRGARRRAAVAGRARPGGRRANTRTSSPAASASASRSPARWPRNPEFIVCDEPTSALDVSVQAQILNLMRDLQDRLGPDLSVHQPQPRGGAPHGDPRRRHVSRPHRRDRAVARAVRAPRHPYTRMLLDAVPDLDHHRPRAQAGRGRNPEPDRAAARLPLSSALPVCVRALPRRAPALLPAGATTVACHAVEEGKI